MGSFLDHVAAAQSPIFMALQGESITVQPKGGEVRTVQAIIERQPEGRMTSRAGSFVMYQPKVRVTLYQDVTLGVSSGARELEGMKVTLALRYGETASTLQVGQENVKSTDGGMVVLEWA